MDKTSLMKSCPNVIVAMTNLACIYPIMIAIKKDDIFMAALVVFAAFWSIIYHLVESHKHDMYGFGSRASTSRFYLQIDRVGALSLSLATVARLIERFNFSLALMGLLTLIPLLISEFPGVPKSIYIPCHCIWHISAFYYCAMMLDA